MSKNFKKFLSVVGLLVLTPAVVLGLVAALPSERHFVSTCVHCCENFGTLRLIDNQINDPNDSSFKVHEHWPEDFPTERASEFLSFRSNALIANGAIHGFANVECKNCGRIEQSEYWELPDGFVDPCNYEVFNDFLLSISWEG